MKKAAVAVILLFKSVSGYALQETSFDSRCRDFFVKTEKFEREQSTRKMFGSERAALHELKLASEYPEFPQSQNTSSKEAFRGGEMGCDPVRYFVWFRRLIRSGKRYHFNAEERHRIASYLMTHLRSDAEGPKPLLNFSLDLKLLQAANDHSIFVLSAEKDSQLRSAMAQLALVEKVEPRTEADFEEVQSTAGEPITSEAEKQRELRLTQILQTESGLSEQIRNSLRGLLDLPPDDSFTAHGKSVSSSEF